MYVYVCCLCLNDWYVSSRVSDLIGTAALETECGVDELNVCWGYLCVHGSKYI